MLTLIFLVLASSVVAIMLASRPGRLVEVAIWAWFLLPAAVVSDVVGVPLDGNRFIHPASAVVLAGLVVQLMQGRHWDRFTGAGRAGITAVVAAVALVGAQCALHGSGYALWINQWAAPVAAFFLIGVARNLDENSTRRVARTFLLAMGVVAVVALVGSATASRSPFADVMSRTYYWFDSDVSISRQSSTTDGPLVLAFLCTVSIALVPVYKRLGSQLLLAALAVAGSVLSQSRTATLLCVIALVLLLLRRTTQTRTRVAGVALCAIGYVAIVRYGFLEQISSRFQNDNGSSRARNLAWSAFLDHLGDIGVTGFGPGSSVAYARSLGLTTSFESAFAGFTVEFGVVCGVLAFGGMFLLVVSKSRRRADVGLHGSLIAAVAALVLIQSFSSLNTQTLLGFALWTVMGIAVFGRDRSKKEDAHVATSVEPSKRLHHIRR